MRYSLLRTTRQADEYGDLKSQKSKAENRQNTMLGSQKIKLISLTPQAQHPWNCIEPYRGSENRDDLMVEMGEPLPSGMAYGVHAQTVGQADEIADRASPEE